MASARARQPFTHFLSIPLNTAPVQEAFHTFQEEVKRLAPAQAVFLSLPDEVHAKLEPCKGPKRPFVRQNPFLDNLCPSVEVYIHFLLLILWPSSRSLN